MNTIIEWIRNTFTIWVLVVEALLAVVVVIVIHLLRRFEQRNLETYNMFTTEGEWARSIIGRQEFLGYLFFSLMLFIILIAWSLYVVKRHRIYELPTVVLTVLLNIILIISLINAFFNAIVAVIIVAITCTAGYYFYSSGTS